MASTSHHPHVNNGIKQRLISGCVNTRDCFVRVCCNFVTNPLVSVVVVVAVASLSLGLGAYAVFRVKPSPVIEKSINAFGIPNHPVTQNQDAYDVAISEYQKYLKTSQSHVIRRSVVNSPLRKKVLEGSLLKDVSSWFVEKIDRERRSADDENQQLYQYNRMQVVNLIYLADRSDNIFTVDNIATVREFEKLLVDSPQFSDFCYMVKGECAPLNSIIKYLDSQMVYKSQQALDEAVRKLLSTRSGIYYTDGHVSGTNIKSRFLRTDIQFGSPLPGYSGPSDRATEQKAKFDAYLGTLLNFLSRSSTKDVRILYGGNGVFDYQVTQTLWNDLRLAVFAVATIVILMLILTSFSIWLTICGIITIILSFPLAFFFYRVVFNVVNLGILNGVAAFVIVGIGVDDVFVFINTFRQAHSISCLSSRMLHTIKTAGKATFFTSFTTAAAFAANLSSSIPAVHDFGLFMTLIVTCCWLLVVLLMPAFINLWYKWFMCCESACFGCCLIKCNTTCVKQLPEDVANFFKSPSAGDQLMILDDSDVMLLSAEESGPIQISEICHSNGQHANPSYECDDVLLPLDEEMLAENVGRDTRLRCNGGDIQDDPLLILEEELLLADNQQSRHRASPAVKEGCSLNVQLQSLMYHYIAVPVVKARPFIIVTFTVLFIISVGFVSQLKPATKPPQLYRPGTNLQMWLDLMANYSSQGVSSNELPSNSVPVPSTVRPSSTLWTDFPRVHTTISPMIVSTSTISTSTALASTSSGSTTAAFLSSSTNWPSHASTTVLTSFHYVILNDTLASSESRALVSTTSVGPSVIGLSSSGVPQSSTSVTSHSWTNLPTHPTERVSTTHEESSTATLMPTKTSQISTAVSIVNIPQHVPLERGITVNIVFGISGIDRSNVSSDHVFTEKGKVIYNTSFEEYFNKFQTNVSFIAELCRICTAIGSNSQLVRANSSRCLPDWPAINRLIDGIEECNNVPRNNFIVDGKLQVGLYEEKYLKWLSFSFESTTFKGMSSFAAYKQYQQWQTFIDELRSTLAPNSPLRDFFQTADFWKQVIMEIVAVSSAVYGLVLSMGICIVTVAIFTGHVGLLVITVSTLLGLVFFVVAVFYWVGWELGAIEAISLSVLIGSSVDYCVHIVEGYILAGRNPPSRVSQDARGVRQWRARVAVSHIGVSVLSSALTTLAAALPLTQAILLPFARFGQIVAINAAVSVVYALTLCVALLATMAPSSFKSSIKSTLLAVGVTTLVVGGATLLLFGISRINGVHIPGPSGSDLFASK